MQNDKKEGSNQDRSSSILSNDLNKHYISHGVVGLESFIKQGDSQISSTVSSSSSPNKESSSNSDNHHLIRTSRFIRLNPRYDKEETLALLTVSFLFLFCVL